MKISIALLQCPNDKEQPPKMLRSSTSSPTTSKEKSWSVKSNIKDLYGIDPTAPPTSTHILCQQCQQPLVKPNTVLYGRNLPPTFFSAVEEDFPQQDRGGGGGVDILFVVGTSLTVHPASSVPDHATACMRVLVDVHPVGGGMFDFDSPSSRDIFLQGECDVMFVNLAKELGWLEEMASFDAAMSDASRMLVANKLKELQDQEEQTKIHHYFGIKK